MKVNLSYMMSSRKALATQTPYLKKKISVGRLIKLKRLLLYYNVI